jgi:hypothetical protein
VAWKAFLGEVLHILRSGSDTLAFVHPDGGEQAHELVTKLRASLPDDAERMIPLTSDGIGLAASAFEGQSVSVILLISAGISEREAVQDAIKLLNRRGLNVVACVLLEFAEVSDAL